MFSAALGLLSHISAVLLIHAGQYTPIHIQLVCDAACRSDCLSSICDDDSMTELESSEDKQGHVKGVALEDCKGRSVPCQRPHQTGLCLGKSCQCSAAPAARQHSSYCCSCSLPHCQGKHPAHTSGQLARHTWLAKSCFKKEDYRANNLDVKKHP